MSAAVDQLDLAWVLICSALIFTMQAGFCLLEAGLVRAKNSVNVAIKNLMDFCVSSLLFWAIGFGLMFGTSVGGWIGVSHFSPGAESGPKFLAFLLFQVVFCSTATTIVSGAVAERMRFGAYLVLCAVLSCLVYPLLGHWVWNDGPRPGWLRQLGFVDFAGSTVVHSLGAWFALATLLAIGPRRGRFDAGTRLIRPHNLILATLGVFLLWFGWFGFNGGSSLAPDGVAARAILNTILAGAAGGIAGGLTAWKFIGQPRIEPMLNGVLGGLVGVTAGCHVFAPWAAAAVGGAAGAIVFFADAWLIRWKIDDAVSAVPVHGFAGVWGTLAVAIFASPAALGFAGRSGWHQMGVQTLGVLVCGGFAFGAGWLTCRVASRFMTLRAEPEDELAGLNFAEHGASTDLGDLLDEMQRQQQTGDFSQEVGVEPHTEVGQIAERYNRVLKRVQREISAHATAEQRYRDIFENAIEGIYQSSPEGHYLTANPALARIYGYESPEELMATVSDISRQVYVHPGRRQEFAAALEQDGQFTGFESEVYRRDGQIIWISESGHAVRHSDGTLLYYEGTVEDITRRKENERLICEKQRADAASAAKSNFLARMSHEIRTPLNGVVGMLELLEGTPLSPQQSQYTRICHSSAQALLSVINDILDLSKIEAGKLTLERIEFDLQEVVDDIVEMFGHRAESRGLTLLGLIDADVPQLVVNDPERLRQVLINLVNNAIKFTETGDVRVQVCVVLRSAEAVELRFAVADSGPGIPLEKQAQLFEAFSQLDVSTARTHGGSGLGLTICRDLVELMGGRLQVESQPGSGATFWFSIPCAISPRNAEDEAPVCLQQTRILVVDDHEDNRRILRDHLRWMGCEPELVPDAETAWDLLTSEGTGPRRYDLLLLDQHLPGMDGLTLAARIQSLWGAAAPPVVMLISWDRTQTQRELEAHGITASLSKPIRRSRLLDAVLTGLRRRVTATTLQLPSRSVAVSGHAERPRVLVLEDHEVNQIVVEELLSSLGYSAKICRNGVEGLEAVKSETFEIILADCQMPEMDGFEFARRLRSWEQATGRSRTSIVALTASAVVGERERCLEAGMDDFLSKPVHRTSLLQVLTRRASQESAEPPIGPAHREPAPPVDLAALRERSGGSMAFQQRILGKFSRRAVADLRELELACIAKAWPRARTLAHGLKGAAATVSAGEIAATAERIEHAAVERPDEVESLLDPLQGAVLKFQKWWEQTPATADEETQERDSQTLLVGER